MYLTKLKKAVMVLSGLVLALGTGTALADYKLNMRQGVTSISNDIYDLHMIVLWLVTITGIAVFAVMIYSIINHRKSKGAVAAQFHENTTVEVVWTIIPLVILVALAVPATKVLLALEDSSEAEVNIKVTGYQWKWEYDYLDEGVSFFSNLNSKHNEVRQKDSGKDPASVENYLLDVDNPIVIPIKKKVRFLITANDVIHAWWVPDLGVKRDAIPGFVNESWAYVDKPGVYRGQCAELCGKDHGFMPIVVIAKEEAEYKKWLVAQKAAKAAAAAGADRTWSKADLMAKGQQVYNTSCAACHMPNGEGIPNVFPAIKGGKISTGPVADHINIVVKGKAGTAMQAFGAQLNDVDLAAVVTYERNAFGNNTGDVVQPKQIKAAR